MQANFPDTVLLVPNLICLCIYCSSLLFSPLGASIHISITVVRSYPVPASTEQAISTRQFYKKSEVVLASDEQAIGRKQFRKY
jgi:hypothetical protein